MRVAAPEFGPVAMIALRTGIAALMLSPLLFDARTRGEIRSHWKPLLIVGITNSALPFCMFGYSMLYLNAGFDAILNATTPLWTAAIAALWFRTPLTRTAVLGLALGVTGVGVLVSDSLSLQGANVPAAIAAVMIATLSYGFAANYSKRHLVGIKPTTVAFASMAFAALILLVPALAMLPAAPVSVRAWLATLSLGVFCTGFAYVLYFRLIAQVGAAFAASVTFLVPVFGMIWGALFLSERVTPLMLAGCVVILLGAALIAGKIRLPGRAFGGVARSISSRRSSRARRAWAADGRGQCKRAAREASMSGSRPGGDAGGARILCPRQGVQRPFGNSPCRRASSIIESTNIVSTVSACSLFISSGLDSMNSLTPSTRLMKPIAMTSGSVGVATPAR